MKFLADENFPRQAVDALRGMAIDVIAIADQHSGLADDEVLALCVLEGRTLLTFDKDFGELTFRRGLPAECGIILFRMDPSSPTEVASVAVLALCSEQKWAGSFAVVTRDRIRLTPLPSGS